jgi:hypothetical protein
VRRFLESEPDSFTVAMVADWIDSLRAIGPPAEGVSVWEDDELYLAAVPRTLLVCRYFVVVYERLIVLDHFDQP